MKLSVGVAALFLVLHLVILIAPPILFIDELYYPFREIVRNYPPFLLTPLGAFDGAHYILIANGGYSQFQQAFFPLYPLLVKAVSGLTFENYLLAGLLIAWASFFIGLYYFRKLAIEIDKKNASFIVVSLLFFPTSFYYLTVYPEGLFLLTSSTALFFIYKKSFFLAAVFATLSSLTKIQGVFLLIPFIVSAFEISTLSPKVIVNKVTSSFKMIPVALSPLYGISLYSIYLFFEYGDPLYYYHSQEAFGAERTSEGLILLPQVVHRYINIFLTAQHNFQYFIAVVEFLMFGIVFLVLLFETIRLFKERKKTVFLLSINLYSLAALILPTLTGTFSSIPRYALVSFGFFFALARINNTKMRIIFLIIIGLLHLLLFSYFINGYFVS